MCLLPNKNIYIDKMQLTCAVTSCMQLLSRNFAFGNKNDQTTPKYYYFSIRFSK